MKTITRSITYYVAEDGTEFTSKSNCEEHEKLLKIPEYFVVIDKRSNAFTRLFSTREDAKKYVNHEFDILGHLKPDIYICSVRLDQYKR